MGRIYQHSVGIKDLRSETHKVDVGKAHIIVKYIIVVP